MTATEPTANWRSIIDESVDPLNDPLEAVTTIRQTIEIYLGHSDRFHLDNTSGGDKERQEQFNKFIITLLSPPLK